MLGDQQRHVLLERRLDFGKRYPATLRGARTGVFVDRLFAGRPRQAREREIEFVGRGKLSVRLVVRLGSTVATGVDTPTESSKGATMPSEREPSARTL